MWMKQTVARTSVYSADVFGACSVLFELGGMTVIHDPSGCNSTYATHDEPRWYDTDSLCFISGLTEMDAIMGGDDTLIRDVVSAARDLSPRFITLVQSPVPYMTGMDLTGAARVIEAQTHIPSYALPTNSMHSYLYGAAKAFAMLAEHMVHMPAERASAPAPEERGVLSVNILGLTPLDFSVNGSDTAMVRILLERGFRVLSTWAMGSTLDAIAGSSAADVDLVVSYSGLEAARVLQRRFDIPYVVGVPIGNAMISHIAADLRKAAEHNENIISYENRMVHSNGTVIIGESIYSASLAMAMENEWDLPAAVWCPVDTEPGLLHPRDRRIASEGELMTLLADATRVIADPLYKAVCPDSVNFVPLPHEAFSGRLFRQDIPNLITGFSGFRTAAEE